MQEANQTNTNKKQIFKKNVTVTIVKKVNGQRNTKNGELMEN